MSLIYSDEIRSYREMEVTLMVQLVKDLLKGNESPDYFRGALEALRKVILLPKRLASPDVKEQQELANMMIDQALEQLEKRTTRVILGLE